MELSIVTITPELAAEWLAINPDNRLLRKSRVDQYAAAMTRGEWHMTGEAVMRNGTRLLNGQHRLAACVQAGVPFTTVVATGIDVAAMTVMDSGLPRSMGDVLRFNGLANVHATAAAARLLLEWRAGVLRDPARARTLVTRDDIAAVVLANTSEFHEAVMQGGRVQRAIGMGPSMWATVAFEAARIDAEVAGTFIDRLVDGAALSDNSPILALRNWAVNSVANHRSRRKWEVVAAGAKAWNAYVQDKPMKQMKVLPSEDVPGLVAL